MESSGANVNLKWALWLRSSTFTVTVCKMVKSLMLNNPYCRRRECVYRQTSLIYSHICVPKNIPVSYSDQLLVSLSENGRVFGVHYRYPNSTTATFPPVFNWMQGTLTRYIIFPSSLWTLQGYLLGLLPTLFLLAVFLLLVLLHAFDL